MSLYAKLAAAHVAARKEKLTFRATLIGTVLGDIQNAAKVVNGVKETPDSLVESKLKSFRKKAHETLSYGNITIAKRLDLQSEIQIIEEFLPMQHAIELPDLEEIVNDLIAHNGDKVEAARTKPELAKWFVGQVMKASHGKANPQSALDLVKSKIGI